MVFVGPVFNNQYPEYGEWPFCKMAYCFADTIGELRDFGEKLFRKDHPIVHSYKTPIPIPRYTISLPCRRAAIRLGARPLDREAVKRWVIGYVATDPENFRERMIPKKGLNNVSNPSQ